MRVGEGNFFELGGDGSVLSLGCIGTSDLLLANPLGFRICEVMGLGQGRYRFPIYYDPWMDNGLETLYHVLSGLEESYPQVLAVELADEAVELEIKDYDRFRDLLAGALSQQIEGNLYYMTEKDGVRKKTLKRFVAFASQPPSNRPSLYKAPAEQKQLIDDCFAAYEGRKNRVCVICGQAYDSRNAAELTLSVNPYATKIRSLSGRTGVSGNGSLEGLRDYFQICPRCYLIGALEWVDRALLYRSLIGGKTSVVLLPFPLSMSLTRLHEIKNGYTNQLRPMVRLSNVVAHITRKGKESEDIPVGQYCLLLAFTEKVLGEIMAEKSYQDAWDLESLLWGRVQRRIADNWSFIEIPEGQMKNVKAQNLVLEMEIMRVLAKVVEAGAFPYLNIIALIYLVDREGKFLNDNDLAREVKERLAQSLFRDDFDTFALTFLPGHRHRLSFSWGPDGVEGSLMKLIQKWRWDQVGLGTEELEILKKAGRAIAKACERNVAVFYALERAKNPTDMLETLGQVVHRLVGMEAEELKYVSLDSVSKVSEMFSTQPNLFRDLKSTLVIFSGIEYAKQNFRGSEG